MFASVTDVIVIVGRLLLCAPVAIVEVATVLCHRTAVDCVGGAVGSLLSSYCCCIRMSTAIPVTIAHQPSNNPATLLGYDPVIQPPQSPLNSES